MNIRTLAPVALSSLLLAACTPGGTPTPGATTNGETPDASGDFCVIAQSVVNHQQDVADALRAISTNSVSGIDMGTAEGWAVRQQLSTDAIAAANSLIADYAAGDPLISDPTVVTAWDSVSQFYSASVVVGNQRILDAPDQTTFLTSGDSEALPSTPVDSQVAVQNYITDNCGFLVAQR